MDDLLTVGRLLVGAIFGLSFMAKVRVPGSFAEALRALGFLPARLSTPLALIVIAAEGATATAFLTGMSFAVVLPFTAVLVEAFALVSVQNLLRHDPLPCHCFGPEPRAQPRRAAIRVALLLLIVGSLQVGSALDAASPAPIRVEHVLLVIAMLTLGMWAFAVPELIEARARFRLPAEEIERRARRRVSYLRAPLSPIVENRSQP